jgi:hypothetical protein
MALVQAMVFAPMQETVRCAMNRMELISGPERRRRWSWSEDQKRSIAAEAFAAGYREGSLRVS